MKTVADYANRLMEETEKISVGKRDQIELILAAVLTGL